jgi:hypothetical protein
MTAKKTVRKQASAVEEGGGLPVYPSMKAASGATGIPVPVLRQAKGRGCHGFRHNRVYLRDVLEWLFSQGDDADIDWGQELKKAQAQREKIRLAKDRQEVVDRGEVSDAIRAGMARLFGVLRKVFVQEMPPRVQGLKAMEVRRHIVAGIDEAEAAFRDQVEKYAAEVEPEEDEG